MSVDESLLLAARSDFWLLRVDARLLLRVDGWRHSGVGCMVVSYTEKKGRFFLLLTKKGFFLTGKLKLAKKTKIIF